MVKPIYLACVYMDPAVTNETIKWMSSVYLHCWWLAGNVLTHRLTQHLMCYMNMLNTRIHDATWWYTYTSDASRPKRKCELFVQMQWLQGVSWRKWLKRPRRACCACTEAILDSVDLNIVWWTFRTYQHTYIEFDTDITEVVKTTASIQILKLKNGCGSVGRGSWTLHIKAWKQRISTRQ